MRQFYTSAKQKTLNLKKTALILFKSYLFEKLFFFTLLINFRVCFFLK